MTRRVELPNREWLVDFRLPQPLTQNDKWVLIGLGIGGSMIALLLGFVSHLLIREKRRSILNWKNGPKSCVLWWNTTV